MDTWPIIHAERKALAADLAALDASQWATPSLCSGWTVRDALAHMTSGSKVTLWSFFPKLAASGFNRLKLEKKVIEAEKGASASETLANFGAVVNSLNRPPVPADGWLGEMIVHAEDIRHPLGIKHDYPLAALMQIAGFYSGMNLFIGAKRRIAGLTLRATDAEWSHGTGPEVTGPMITLVMAMTGRRAAYEDLTGEGVTTLRSRP